jgi:aminoglycoside phosphotransferase (APT) family kinase protein
MLPDLQTLTANFSKVLTTHGFAAARLSILDRQPNIYASTFPSEIVTCQFGDGSERRLLCKYGAGHDTSLSGVTGHKGGVPYEAAVYRHVLRTSQATTPTFYGAYRDGKTDHTWLILEYLDDSKRLHRTREPSTAIGLAARWIGQFHNATEQRLSRTSMRFLTRYDTDYYLGWARRTSLLTGHLRRRFPWLTTLCERFEDVVALLLASPPTVIHGEYYPMNILVGGGKVYPVDWESAAVAAGEIDLAALTENWGAEIERQCELEYQRARWPKGSPVNFEDRLCAAQVYLQFRWLCHENRDIFTREGIEGERSDWNHEAKGNLYRLEQLRFLGERLGLIGRAAMKTRRPQATLLDLSHRTLADSQRDGE